MNKAQAYITASKFYLCEPLPEDFDELDEQEVTDFIRDNQWEPFDRWEPHGIWELIEDLASEFLTIANTENTNQPMSMHDLFDIKMPVDQSGSALEAIRQLRNEVNCRIEHGAESGGHLEFVQTKLDEITTQ